MNDSEYRGIRDAKNLFDLSIDEYYYKPIKTNGALNSNYIEYESKGDKNNTLSIKEYLNMIRPYLRDIINDHKTQGEWKVYSGNIVINYKAQGEWKIQLTIIINFISSKDSDEICTSHTKSNNIEIMTGNDTHEIIEEFLEPFLQKYQQGLEEKMRESEFVFDSVDLLHYDLTKISLNWGGSYIDSPEWLKNKKATINPKNNDNKCFQYAQTVALNCEQIKKNPQRISNIKPFIDQYNWKEIDFPSHKKDRKNFELNNKSIALNILCGL